MNNKKKGLVLSILGIIGLIAITVGVTYAFFNYAKEGTTDNTITTGTITFLYTEVSGVGKGISIKDAYPISDSVGKAQTGEGKVFDFKVTSTTTNSSAIPYEVTARKKAESTLDEEAVKLYLTKVSGTNEEEVLLNNYSNLTQTTKVTQDKYIEKTIYTGKVPANSTNYEQNFRLRMWIDDSIDFSPIKDENGQDVYPYNDKAFTVTVNVYANAKVVTDEDIENESKAEISSLSVDGTELTKVDNANYDYETNLPEGTTSTTINIETVSEYATVTVERIDSLALETSNIKRLSTKKTLELNPGNNYFKITVTSENGEIETEYKLKISVFALMDSSYSLAIGDSVTAKDGSKWHVLEASASGVETVVLLSDYNLNADGTYNTECGKNINSAYNCNYRRYNSSNSGIYSEESPGDTGYFIKYTYAPLVTNALSNVTNITLPTAHQIAKADGKTFDTSSLTMIKLTNSWLVTTNYWTKNHHTMSGQSHIVWAIDAQQSQFGMYAYADIRAGVRPVITTPKSNLLAE